MLLILGVVNLLLSLSLNSGVISSVRFLGFNNTIDFFSGTKSVVLVHLNSTNFSGSDGFSLRVFVSNEVSVFVNDVLDSHWLSVKQVVWCFVVNLVLHGDIGLDSINSGDWNCGNGVECSGFVLVSNKVSLIVNNVG